MLGWIARILLIIAGFITSIFFARNELNFQIIQMVVAVILFTLVVMMIAFWPSVKKLFMRKINKQKPPRK